MAEETRAHWANAAPPGLINPSPDPAIAAIEQQELMAINVRFGDERAVMAKNELKEAIAKTNAILSSPRLASVMNLRDKHLAHSLTETSREKKGGTIEPMKYGDETALLNDSIPIIETLFCWVNGKGFSIKNSQKIDAKNAHALWHGCKFDVLR